LVVVVVVVEFGVCAVVGISKFKFLKQICENVGSVFVYRLTISIDEKKNYDSMIFRNDRT